MKVNIFSSFLPNRNLISLVQSTQVASYIPGRVRLYSKQLINNSTVAKALQDILEGYREIDKVKINLITGSVLLEYQPKVLRKNKELFALENYIRGKAPK